jgi:hypothetical protein
MESTNCILVENVSVILMRICFGSCPLSRLCVCVYTHTHDMSEVLSSAGPKYFLLVQIMGNTAKAEFSPLMLVLCQNNLEPNLYVAGTVCFLFI